MLNQRRSSVYVPIVGQNGELDDSERLSDSDENKSNLESIGIDDVSESSPEKQNDSPIKSTFSNDQYSNQPPNFARQEDSKIVEVSEILVEGEADSSADMSEKKSNYSEYSSND